MAVELLRTKLAIPPLRADLVTRGELLARLDEGVARKLTLISAPAGFGKTTLVAAWARRAIAADETPTSMIPVWLSMDEGDNDPARFLVYVVAALQEVCPVMGGGATLSLLQAPHLPPLEQILTSLINEIAAQYEGEPAQGRCVLILDDYHVVTNEAIHAAISFLLSHLPPVLRLVIVTRADPPLALARLRAQGELMEVRQAELRFTVEEAEHFLRDVMSLGISGKEASLLAARTEGWIAGLQMAALSMKQCDDVAQFVDTFGGSHRFVLDYLLEEVLQSQSPAIQSFLLQTSIVEQVCASLCDALLAAPREEAEVAEKAEAAEKAGVAVNGLRQSQAVLEYLERHNLFVVPLDDERRWYRYHGLFAELLRWRLQQAMPERIAALHGRASAWYETQGDLDRAINHALAAGDEQRAADLVTRAAEGALMHGEVATLLAWVEALPERLVLGRPYLSLLYAWALLASGRPAQSVETHLVAAERGELEREWAAVVRAYLAAMRGEFKIAYELACRAQSVLGEENPFLRDLAALVRGLSARATGEAVEAAEALEEATAMSRAADDVMLTVLGLCGRAGLAAQEGDLTRAQVLYEQALVAARNGDQNGSLFGDQPGEGQLCPVAGEALVGLGKVALRRNELEEAATYIEEGIRLNRQWSGLAALEGTLVRSALLLAQGDERQAEAVLQEAALQARTFDATELDDAAVALAQTEMALRRGDLATVQRWLDSRDLPHGEAQMAAALGEGALRADEYLLLARLRLAQARTTEAMAILERLAPFLEPYEARLDALLLLAVARLRQSDEEGALAMLAEALSLGESGGYVRVFLDEVNGRRELVALLHEAKRRGLGGAYVDRLLAALQQASPDTSQKARGPSPLLEPLSEREQEVLALVAKGLTNQQVAERLCLSLATVKWHNSNIYGKLGVSNRVEAVRKADELGLLELA